MPLPQDEYKQLISAIGAMIISSHKTLETNLKAEMRDMEKRIRGDMATKDELEEVRQQMATKEDIKKIRQEMATKDDIKSLRDKKDGAYQKRFEVIEEELGITHAKRN